MAGLQLFFAPVYLFFLGPTSYGLLGFYSSLLLSLAFLDQALSPVLSRELARISAGDGGADQARSMLLTFELLSCAVAVALGLAIWYLGPYIASHWIRDDSLSEERLTFIVRLMGITIACHWPTFLYNAGFVGLQRQDTAMRLRIVTASIQWAGAALVLWALRPEVELFFFWQVITLALTSLVMRVGLWRLMPFSPNVSTFNLKKLRPVIPFAAGSLAIGLTGSLLTQVDKLLVAKYASLDQLAGYSLCFLAASLLSAFVSQPVSSGLLPLFVNLISTKNEQRLAVEYHLWTQCVAVVAFPVTAALIFFPNALAYVWLPSNSPINELVTDLIPWIAAGTLFNVLCTFPYVLQMAAGRTKLLLFKNILTLTVVLPILVYFMPDYGPVIGAYCWLAVNVSYYLLEAPIMHCQLLKGELRKWWLNDTLSPGIFVGTIFIAADAVFPNQSGWGLVALATGTALISMALLVVCLRGPRLKLLDMLNKKDSASQ